MKLLLDSSVWVEHLRHGALDPLLGPLRGRFALYNEFVRDSARRHGATVVDFWRLREYRDWRYWDPDRMHMGPAGHQRMAIEVLDTLGVDHDLEPLPLPDVPTRSRSAQVGENLDWVRSSAAPWVHRRLTGRSSGDSVGPKYPTLARLAAPVVPRVVSPGGD